MIVFVVIILMNQHHQYNLTNLTANVVIAIISQQLLFQHCNLFLNVNCGII